MYKITQKRLLSSLLLVSITLQACGVSNNRQTPDGASEGVCTGTLQAGGCNEMDFDLDPSGVPTVTPGSGADALNEDATIRPNDNSFESEPRDEDLPAVNAGAEPSSSPHPRGEKSGLIGLIGALGHGVGDLFGGLGNLFGDAQKKMKEKKKRVMKGIEEAHNVAEQLVAIEKEVREEYNENTEFIKILASSEIYDNDRAIRNVLALAAQEHNRQLDAIVGKRPSLSSFTPDASICRELGNCNYRSLEQQKVVESRAYLNGAQAIVSSQYSGQDKAKRELILEVGNSAIDAADASYQDGDLKEGDAWLELGIAAADLALSVLPGIGLGKDIYEASTGYGFIDGRPLTRFEISMAIISVATLGFAKLGQFSKLGKLGKVLRRGAVSAEEAAIAAKDAERGGSVVFAAERTDVAIREAVEGADEILDSAKTLGMKSTEDVKAFANAVADVSESRLSKIVSESSRILPNGQIQTFSPDIVKFSQTSVNGVEELTESMRRLGWPESAGAIDVVKLSDGTLATVDNTRVLAASRAGINVRATVRSAGEAIDPSRAVTLKGRDGNIPETWEQAVKNRISTQNKAYRERYPNGSYTTGSVE